MKFLKPMFFDISFDDLGAFGEINLINDLTYHFDEKNIFLFLTIIEFQFRYQSFHLFFLKRWTSSQQHLAIDL